MRKLPEGSSDALIGQVLEAVQSDRWLPILNPPFDFTEIDPRKAAVLTKASHILGRLGVATHVAYKETYNGEYAPLLKEAKDKERGRFQYLYRSSNPNYYYLVYLIGTVPDKSKRELICQSASFILIPEALKEASRTYFIRKFHPGLRNGEGYSYTPKFMHNDYMGDDEFLSAAKEATTLVFNGGGDIEKLGFYIHTEAELFVASYQFDFENAEIRFSRYNALAEQWNYSSEAAWNPTSFFLHQDGLLRSAQGEIEKTPLDEALAVITTRIPLTHYLK